MSTGITKGNIAQWNLSFDSEGIQMLNKRRFHPKWWLPWWSLIFCFFHSRHPPNNTRLKEWTAEAKDVLAGALEKQRKPQKNFEVHLSCRSGGTEYSKIIPSKFSSNISRIISSRMKFSRDQHRKSMTTRWPSTGSDPGYPTSKATWRWTNRLC